MAHPYRPSPPLPERPPPELDDALGRALMLAVFWLSSLLRFALAVRHHERFGFQPALALALTVLPPLVIARGWVRERRGRGTGGPR